MKLASLGERLVLRGWLSSGVGPTSAIAALPTEDGFGAGSSNLRTRPRPGKALLRLDRAGLRHLSR